MPLKVGSSSAVAKVGSQPVAVRRGSSLVAAAPPAAGAFDPQFANVSLLLHMNGTNGSSVFSDSSSASRAVTAIGNVAINTSQSKFGGASGFSNGGGGYLTFSNSVFDFGVADFTIEFWLYATGINADTGILGAGRSAGVAEGFNCYLRHDNSHKLSVDAKIDGQWTSPAVISASAASTGEWEHWAITRYGGTLKLWRNGALQDAREGAGDIQFPATQPGSLFSTAGDGEFASHGGSVWIDEFRVTKGSGGARYTSAFTPPGAAFPGQ